MNEGHQVIERVASRTLVERVNVPQMTEWIHTNPERFETLLNSLDLVITGFNRSLTSSIPDNLTNLRALQTTFQGEQLPTTKEMLSESGKGRLKAFLKAMKTMNAMMERGESTREEPYLWFHATNTDEEALVVGGIFHGYEELMKTDDRLKNRFVHDQLINGLIEVLAQQQENPLYSAVAGETRLNWINGWEGFSPSFRQGLGFA